MFFGMMYISLKSLPPSLPLENVSTLFRASSLSTMLMDQFMKLTALDYLRSILTGPVKQIMECPDSCEVGGEGRRGGGGGGEGGGRGEKGRKGRDEWKREGGKERYRVLQNLCNKNCIAVVQAYCSGYYSSK